jgi:hypothetical protein
VSGSLGVEFSRVSEGRRPRYATGASGSRHSGDPGVSEFERRTPKARTPPTRTMGPEPRRLDPSGPLDHSVITNAP